MVIIMRKILSALLSTAIIASTLVVSSVYATDDITVELDGEVIDFDVAPQIINGRTMVPLRKIFEEIGAFVKWDSETQTVSARKSSKTVTLSIGSNSLEIDKGKTDDEGNAIVESITLEVPAQIVSGRTLVPARAISESFGLNVDWVEDNQKVVITSDGSEDNLWKENVGWINLSDLTFEGDGIEIDKNQIKITSGGDYTISGTLADGNIIVSTKEKVKLRLDGVSITSSENPCIFVEEADKAYITLTEGTENFLNAKNSENSAIYSKDNLEIKGNGKLSIYALMGHGIKASDNLSIENGDITINASNDGIHINDTFKMTDGKLNITAVGDGIDSESIVNILGGTINIETTAEPIENGNNSEIEQNDDRRGTWNEKANIEFEYSSKGINAQWMMCILGGEIAINSASHAIHCDDETEINGGEFNINSKYEKGISSHGNLTINGSDTIIDIQKSTEGLESKNVLTVNDGTIKVIASDDAINATGKSSGEMFGKPANFNPDGNMGNQAPSKELDRTNQPNPRPQMEWREKPNFEMPNDEKTEFAPNGTRPQGFGGARGDMKDCLIINGGNFELLAGDDCLDSNGNLIINGGTIKASNPNGTFSGASAVVDPDGSVTISEKANLIFAAGSGSGASLQLKQNTITVYCDDVHNADDIIKVSDSNGNIIYEYAPLGKFSSVLISSENIKTGEKYQITVGNETFETTITEQSTVLGTKPVGNMGFGKNRFGQ